MGCDFFDHSLWERLAVTHEDPHAAYGEAYVARNGRHPANTQQQRANHVSELS